MQTWRQNHGWMENNGAAFVPGDKGNVLGRTLAPSESFSLKRGTEDKVLKCSGTKAEHARHFHLILELMTGNDLASWLPDPKSAVIIRASATRDAFKTRSSHVAGHQETPRPLQMASGFKQSHSPPPTVDKHVRVRTWKCHRQRCLIFWFKTASDSAAVQVIVMCLTELPNKREGSGVRPAGAPLLVTPDDRWAGPSAGGAAVTLPRAVSQAGALTGSCCRVHGRCQRKRLPPRSDYQHRLRR